MNIPGHNYVGPGNKLDNGLPVDTDDLIAQHHDWHYANAKNKQDIRNADIEFLWETAKDIPNQ